MLFKLHGLNYPFPFRFFLQAEKKTLCYLGKLSYDGAEVVKDVLVLNPYWVYLVLEDDWGWAYTMTGDTNQVGEDDTYTTSSFEVNPYRFHNEEKTDAVKHVEAIRINNFKTSERDADVELTKSSKVESF